MSIFKSGCAAILVLSAFLFAQNDTLSSREELLPEEPSKGSSLEDSFEPSLEKALPESLASKTPPKTVLYLGGGAFSPWYSLGVLYAVRDYRIPIDSVVGTSWGAFIGALWSQGFELDDIQRIVTDSLFVSQVLKKDPSPKTWMDLPVSRTGTPSLAFRFSLFGDANGYAHFRKKALDADTNALSQTLFRFQVQEALTRADFSVVPFTALACEKGKLLPSSAKSSLPFSNTSGELCPTFVPQDSAFAIYVAAYPLRQSVSYDPAYTVAGFESELEWVQKQKSDSNRTIVIIRPHGISEASPLALMQMGYADVEKKMGEFSPLANRASDRPAPLDSILPRFKIDPSFESFSAASYSHVSERWNMKDTGVAAPANFLHRLSESPFYDSVQIEMDSLGIAKVSALTSPIVEFRVGGLGNNILGPLFYAGVDFRYINQFEYAFTLDGYWGEHSYSVRPALQIQGFLTGKAGVSVTGNISKRRPLKGYFSELSDELKIFEVRENDLILEFDLQDSLADVSVSVLLGEAEFKTAMEEDYGTLRVNSLIPKISFVRNRGGFEEWFGDRGYRIRGELGLRSINLMGDGTGNAPLYFSSTVDIQKAFAPTDFISLGVGALGGVNVRRETGYGYEYPDELEVFPGESDKALENWFRLHPALSPWSSAWNFAEMSSHHYGSLRANAGLHWGILGAWIFGAYMRDFEENPTVELDADRILLEPMLRASYRSLDVRLGMSRLVSMQKPGDLLHVKNYHYFFQVGANW